MLARVEVPASMLVSDLPPGPCFAPVFSHGMCEKTGAVQSRDLAHEPVVSPRETHGPRRGGLEIEHQPFRLVEVRHAELLMGARPAFATV
jgi:hypothetical protein